MVDVVGAPLPVRLDDLLDLVRSSTAGDDPLEHLTGAVLLADGLGELADHLVGHFVDQARRSGASWTDIGRALGVSKQAAQQRFVGRAAVDAEELTSGRFSRFTPRARQAVGRAAAHAREHGASQVGAEHLLIGVLDDRGALAGRSLEAVGVAVEPLREGVLAGLPPASAPTQADDHLPFSAGAKALLDRTLREALLMGHNYVGTEHLLLALFDDDGQAGAALRGTGVEKYRLHTEVVTQLAAIVQGRGGAA